MEFSIKKLHELGAIFYGKRKSRAELSRHGEYLYLQPGNIHSGKIVPKLFSKYISKKDFEKRDPKYLARHGDLLIYLKGKVSLGFYYFADADPRFFISEGFKVIRSKLNEYIFTYLEEITRINEKKVDFKLVQVLKKYGIKIWDLDNINKIEIPIIDIEELNKLSDSNLESASRIDLEELRGYLINHKIIQLDNFQFNEHSLSPSLNIFLKDKSSRNRKYADELPKLVGAGVDSKSKDEIKREEHMRDITYFFEKRFKKLESQLKLINKNIEIIFQHLKGLEVEFLQIKKLPRNEEEKVFKLCYSIDKKLDNIFESRYNIIDKYIEEIKCWFEHWELLESASKKFMPLAEYLFDELSRMNQPDYSPFILEYCRTLENELLKKLFEAFHNHLIEVKINKSKLFEKDLLSKNTEPFAKKIKNDKRDYTIGNMSWIMSLLKEDGDTYKGSELLKTFRKFILQHFQVNILNKEFLDNVKYISENFRNKAAHPYILDLNTALECQILLRRSLGYFLENKKEFESS